MLARDSLCRIYLTRKGPSNRKQSSWTNRTRKAWESIYYQRISKSTVEGRTSREKYGASLRSSDLPIFLLHTRTRPDIRSSVRKKPCISFFASHKITISRPSRGDWQPDSLKSMCGPRMNLAAGQKYIGSAKLAPAQQSS